MAYYRKRFTPSTFYSLFSLGVGVASTTLIHSHRVAPLIAANVIWLGSMAFIHARARKTGGIYLDDDVKLFYGLGIGLYLVGLLLASFYCVLYG